MTKPLPKRDVVARPDRGGRPRLTAVENRALASLKDENLRRVIAELLISSRSSQENFQEIEKWFPIQPADVARGFENEGEGDTSRFWLRWWRKGRKRAAATIRAFFEKESGHHELRLTVNGQNAEWPGDPEHEDATRVGEIRVFASDKNEDSGVMVVAGGPIGSAAYVLRYNSTTKKVESSFLRKSVLQAGKGTLVTADGVESERGLSVGADGKVLAADSTATTGLKWKTPEEVGLKGLEGRSAGFKFTYLTNTESSDPGAGKLKFDKATLSEATLLRISETDGDGNSIAGFLATIDDSTSAIKGLILLRKVGEPSKFALFTTSGILNDNGTWDSMTVAYVASNGLANNDAITAEFYRTGDKGDTGEKGEKGEKGEAGAAGAMGAEGRWPGLHYTWLTNTEVSDPGAGKAKRSNTNSALRISETDKDGNGIAAFLAAWDNSTTTTNRGTVIVRQVGSPKRFRILKVTGALTDEGTWDSIPTELITEGEALENEKEVVIEWLRTGDKGEKGEKGEEGEEGEKGSTGSTGPPGTWAVKAGGNAGSSTGITQVTPAEMTGTAKGAIGTGGEIDGRLLQVGDLFFQFAGAKTDGLWEVTNAGTAATFWRAVRPSGLDTGSTVERSFFYVEGGNTYAHKIFVCDSGGITLGTTELVFRQVATRNYGLVEALPTTPTPIKGDTCEFIADSEKGVVWDLVHTGAAEFPWSCKGISLLAVEEGEQKTKKTAYQTTGAPSVNYPLAGDYYVTFGCASVRAAIAGDTGFVRVGYHSNGELIKEAIMRLDANGAEPAYRKLRHTKRTKGQAAQARYKNDTEAAGETVFEGLFIELHPIRVG